MPQTNINIRMDEDLKKQAEILFLNLGLNMTTAFNIFVRQAVRQGGIPFEVSMKSDNRELRQEINQKLEESQKYAARPDSVRYSAQEFFGRVRSELL